MSLELLATEAPFATAGVVHLALAALLLRLDFHHRANRALALLLVVRGMAALTPLLDFATRPDPAALAFTRSYPYYFFVQPFALLYFAALFPRPQRWLPAAPWGSLPFLAGAVALSALYAWDASLYWGAHYGRVATREWLYLVHPVGNVVAMAVAVKFARDFLRDPASPWGRSALLVSVGLGMSVGFDAAGTVFLGWARFAAFPLGWAWLTLFSGSLALLGALAAMLARAAARSADPGARRAARRTLVALAFPVATVASGLVLPLEVSETALGVALGGVWRLALPVLVTYALLRHQLFDIDLRVKTAVRRGAVVGAFAAVFLVTAEGLRGPLPGTAATLTGLVLALSLGLGLPQLQALADRVANRLIPGVEDSAPYLNRRRMEMYRTELEMAVGPEGIGEADGRRLAELRAELGVTERDHEVLMLALRHGPALGPLRLRPGDTVAERYVVDRVLGEGAHGTTYLAREGERTVALKALRGAERGGPREADALGAVRHPHVVDLLGLVREDGRPYLVMAHLPGGSLRDRLAQGPLDPAAFRGTALGLLAALGAVHAAGHVHRDVKPGNILYDAEGRALLADFGLAREAGAETTAGPADPSTAVGTVRYMSPEQARGRRVGPRGDLFSAAATLYEAWTGRPYLAVQPGESAIEVQLRAAAAEPFQAPFAGPPALRAWFARALDPEPARRFPDAASMARALEAALPPRRRGGRGGRDRGPGTPPA